jgi:hypothetical protein
VEEFPHLVKDFTHHPEFRCDSSFRVSIACRHSALMWLLVGLVDITEKYQNVWTLVFYTFTSIISIVASIITRASKLVK